MGELSIVLVFSQLDLGLIECDLLYLDIEGEEYNAIKGSTSTIMASHPVIVIEDSEKLLKKRDSLYHSGDVSRYLRAQFGYQEAILQGRNAICLPSSAVT